MQIKAVFFFCGSYVTNTLVGDSDMFDQMGLE